MNSEIERARAIIDQFNDIKCMKVQFIDSHLYFMESLLYEMVISGKNDNLDRIENLSSKLGDLIVEHFGFSINDFKNTV